MDHRRLRGIYWVPEQGTLDTMSSKQIREAGMAPREPQQGEARRDHIFASLESWTRDVRSAQRSLRHSPGFSITVLLMLALGIGASTAVFCAADWLLLRAIPYPDPDDLLALHKTQTGKGFRNISLPNLMDWRANSTTFDGARLSAIVRQPGWRTT